jgi:membrane protein
MNGIELGAAEGRILSAREDVAAHVRALKWEAKKKAKSPFVIGGLMLAVAAAGLVAIKRKPPAQRKLSHFFRPENMTEVLKWSERILPLLGAMGVMKKATEPDPRSYPVPIQEPKAKQKESAMQAKAPSSWVSRQWQLFKAAVKGWQDDYAPSMGAALSYYTLFSLAPLLIIVIAVAGLVFGQDVAQGQILEQLRGIMGDEGAVAVEGLLKSAREPSKGIVATIVGVALLLLGATAVFAELQSALDRIWETPARKKPSGIWGMLRTRVLSFGLVLGLAFMLMVSLVVSAALAALGKWWGGWIQGWDVLLEIVNFVVSFGIFTALFAMIYKLMPSVKIAWNDVWTGAAVTSLLFSIGKVLIGLYLGKSTLASGFGAAGSFVVLLAWFYYSAQIFLLGAEYTWAYAKSHGSHAGLAAAGKRAEGGAPSAS